MMMTITTTTTITTSKDAIRDLSTLSCLQQVHSRGKGAIVRKLHATHQPRTTSNMSRAPRYNRRQQSGLLRQLNPFVSAFATTHQAMQTLYTHCRLLTIQHETITITYQAIRFFAVHIPDCSPVTFLAIHIQNYSPDTDRLFR